MAGFAEHLNITVNSEILKEFKKYGLRNGTSISPFVAAKMVEFIAEEKALEESKKNKNK